MMHSQTSRNRQAARNGGAEELPLSSLLFRYIWPFWLFHDASHGDQLARAAAYRHNRGMRVYLPGYLLKWTISNTLAFAVAIGFESLSARADSAPNVFLVMAAGTGMLFVVGICVLCLTAYIYLYLSLHDY